VSSPLVILGYLSLCTAAQIKISVIVQSMADAERPVLTKVVMAFEFSRATTYNRYPSDWLSSSITLSFDANLPNSRIVSKVDSATVRFLQLNLVQSWHDFHFRLARPLDFSRYHLQSWLLMRVPIVIGKPCIEAESMSSFLSR
jgi:hypothetical protein